MVSENVVAAGEIFREFLTLQLHFMAHCLCKDAVNLFRFLLPHRSLQQFAELRFSLNGRDRGVAWMYVLFGGSDITRFENPWLSIYTNLHLNIYRNDPSAVSSVCVSEMWGDGSENSAKRSLKEKEKNHLISWCLTTHGVEGMLVFSLFSFLLWISCRSMRTTCFQHSQLRFHLFV